MKVSDPLTPTDRIKIALLMPLAVLAAMALGITMRLHAAAGSIGERLLNR